MSPGLDNAREKSSDSSTGSESSVPQEQQGYSADNVTSNHRSPLEGDVEDGSSCLLSDHPSRMVHSHYMIRQMIQKDPNFRRNVERLRQELFHVEWANLREPPIQSCNQRYHGLLIWIGWSLACIIPFAMCIAIRELVDTILC